MLGLKQLEHLEAEEAKDYSLMTAAGELKYAEVKNERDKPSKLTIGVSPPPFTTELSILGKLI